MKRIGEPFTERDVGRLNWYHRRATQSWRVVVNTRKARWRRKRALRRFIKMLDGIRHGMNEDPYAFTGVSRQDVERQRESLGLLPRTRLKRAYWSLALLMGAMILLLRGIR